MTDEPPCLTHLLTSLSARAPLDPDDAAAILSLPCSVRTLEPSLYVIREGEPTAQCAVLISGYAFRQKLTGDGERQIVALLIPGDPIDFQTLFLDVADHNVQTLTRAEIGFFPRKALQARIIERPAIAQAIITNILVECSITREWLLNVGRRNARARLAHFLCEFAVRLDQRKLYDDGGYELPMTQEQLGDALGLTSVHVNRTLKGLESEGLIERHGRRIRFAQWHGLREVADFSAVYLHGANTDAIATM